MNDSGSSNRSAGAGHNHEVAQTYVAPDACDAQHKQGRLDHSSDSLEALEAEALELLGQRKRRKRARFSCTECHRRKHKCDRESPCSKCVERGVAHACTPHDGSAQDVHDRMRQLEALLSRFVHASRNAPHRAVPDRLQMADSSTYVPATDAFDQSQITSSLSPHFNAGSSRSTPDSRRNGSSTPRRKSNPGITTAASLPFRAQIGNEVLEFSSSTQSYPPSTHFERLVREGSVKKDEIHSLASALPSQEQTGTLLDVFFRDINPLMFPFDEMWFRDSVYSAVDVIWGEADDLAYAQDGPNHLSVISLLFSVLALTFQSQPLQYGSEASGAAQAVRMSHQARRCNMLAASIQCHDLFIVLSHIILSRFIILQRQGKESWLVLGSAVREAQLLGLHRLGPPAPEHQQESIEVQMRRLTWMHLYYEDRITSLIVGQAPFIHDSYCDTDPPTISAASRLNRNLLDLPTLLHTRHVLSGIVNKVLDLFFSDQHDMTYETVLQLDNELQAFKASLPKPYQMDDDPYLHSLANTDKVLHRNVLLQRYVLHVTIYYVFISIHLPYLRRGSDDSGFARSRQAALEAAVGDHRARRKLREEVDWSDHFAREPFVGGRFFYFHATSTLSICLLSETDVARVKELLPLLDEFLDAAQDHQRQQSVDPDRCIRQEISIVTLIRGRVRRKFGLCDTDATLQGAAPTNPRRMFMQRQNSTVTDSPSTQPRWSACPNGNVESPRLPIDSHTPLRYPTAGEPVRTDLMPTRQPEAGEDAYDWWSWLVSSLSPSDLLANLTPGETAALAAPNNAQSQ